MRKTPSILALASMYAAMEEQLISYDPESEKSHKIYSRTELTPKQRKARSKSKRAKQARKLQR